MNTFIQRRLPHLATVFTAFMLCSASARGASGTVVAWGENGYHKPSTVPLTNVIAIAATFSNSLALKADGHLINWGSEASPATNFSNLVAITAGGGSHYLVLTADGVVDGFGYWNWNARSSMPTNVFNATNIVAIGAGDNHNVVLECDGTVRAWGSGYYGQTNVPAGLSNVTAIACGGYHSLALKRDGTVVGWGDNSWGQTNVPAGLSGVVAIAGGSYYSLALKSDGTVVGWGNNFSGQTNAPAGLSNVVAIATGTGCSLALKSDGTVVAWGANAFGLTNVPAGLSNVIAIALAPVGGAALAIVGSAPPAGQVPLANPSFGPDGFRVSLPTQSGRVYALEYQDTLSNGTWTALPLAAGNGCTLTLKDPTAAGTQRFYRVRQW